MTELSFGVNVPTSAGPGDDPVGLAQEAERLGFDFVSAADHPCGPDPSYETPTMLTWIAARTSRIKVASRVLAVPFRRPAVVAKLATSVDQLSGGRFILGLGAGYDDDEITALGGPALSPAEKVDGLAEAIQVIRGGWASSGFTQQGRHHSVRDLELEPRPAHPIPIWLGTFGPRALAVTGRLADGWIPSLGYRPTEEFDPAAGPQPDLVTGSVPQVVSQLRDLLSLGFTGFNFLVGDPDRISNLRRIAEEIVPALRSTG
jgi:alkanesulfonate monooxygenase SsuD/methylene tetrahydromethanopterin reductase-like flavin-dependent oxidoreductase (luciferase family)